MIDILLDMTFHSYVLDFDIRLTSMKKVLHILIIHFMCTFDFISGGWLQVFVNLHV